MSNESTATDAVHADPADAARAAGLRYVHDDRPGIRREAVKDGFRYLDAKGEPVTDESTLARIKRLVIPPAWTEVWICPQANGHLQATGRDARGRKQYRYHAKWREARDEVKYERMLKFGQALPLIRLEVDRALKLPGLPREKVLATIVYLLEATMMRVGNEEYARTNKSFGLTTLRNRHAKVDGSDVEFSFRGKSGVYHKVKVHDRRLARIVARSRDLPGQELFQYVDEDGATHSIDSSDVNDYLRTITGEEYTAKDFRTWSGTVLAALALQEFEKFDSEAQAKKNIVRAIESVAEKLGNTPSICRKCYVHPAVLDAYLEGAALEVLRERTEEKLAEDLHALQPEEAAVLAMLQQRLRLEQENAATAPPAKRARKPAANKAAGKAAPAKKPRSAARAAA
ncbi:DNA topoisomerase IB [Massilia sp. YIM B02443]|uniref:DNA topoisomerase IB n=1 Tax=Massilia sp. YIM B02443 TaxID=3050127 RepID=UPI0025B6AE6E|nr:DNA topoisomerase IB [Massilia sp. YIM B02443]MDN4040227.1 DNA topoisomerase IB [Massilia sp. YIM B02443]